MIIDLLKEIIFLFNEVSIFLLFGFFAAGVLHIIFPDSIIKKHLGKNTSMSVIKSTLFGIPLPFCSCGVIPVAASLRNAGASKGASISFLISTPQVGADSFFITYSLLGSVFALFRIIASVITAIVAGIAVNIYSPEKKSIADDNPPCIDINNDRAGGKWKKFFSYIQFEIFGSIAEPLIIGIIIAGAISAFVPDSLFIQYLDYPFLSMIFMLIAGIPIYVCASASTPIAAALIMKGMAPGAALVFLLTGPATNAITISTVIKNMGKTTAVIYIISISVISVSLGYLLNIITAEYGFPVIIQKNGHYMFPSYIRHIGTALLTFMIFLHYLKKFYFDNLKTKENNKMVKNKIRLNIQGMSCMHCSSSVKKAVETIKGTSDIRIYLKEKYVEFNIENKDDITDVKNSIIASGFEVV